MYKIEVTAIKHENEIVLHVPTCDRQDTTIIVFKCVKIGRNLLEITFCRECKEEMIDVDIYTIWRGTDNFTIKISIQNARFYNLVLKQLLFR